MGQGWICRREKKGTRKGGEVKKNERGKREKKGEAEGVEEKVVGRKGKTMRKGRGRGKGR